jgi:U4/U6.U5 tri-snRNP component SNU23
MKRREGSLELDKNLNKTMVVQNPGGRGPGQPGFYCEACSRTYKDSVGYLDHINSKARTCFPLLSRGIFGLQNDVDLRVIGQTTRIERSTLQQVRARIAHLREKTKEASNAKSFDFDQRLAEVKAKEDALRADRKAQKKAEKDKARLELVKDSAMDGEDDMAKMMGFGGFGSTKK